MQALRNKKTGRLLVLEMQAEKIWERGVIEEVEGIMKYLELRDSEYPHGIVFCTNQQSVIDDLLKDGKYPYPDIRIDFGWNRTKFELSDLEAVLLQVTTDWKM